MLRKTSFYKNKKSKD